MLAALALLSALLPLVGCDGGGEEPGAVSFERLFAAPTAAEIAAVEADWVARNPEPVNARIVAETTVGGARVVVVAHDMTSGGSTFTHYGVVRVPDGALDRPVVVVHHGGDDGLDLAGYLALLGAYPDVATTTVQVLPVYRSEKITTAGVPGLDPAGYQVGGTASPWDYDVDDAIALMEAALQLFPAATDGDRIGTIGYSRGGNVALLMAARDLRVDVVTDYFGPTDFFDSSIQVLAALVLQGNPQATSLPGARYLRDRVLVPVREGELGYDAARMEIVRRSSALFTARMPALQVHHHRQDGVVPAAQAVALDARRAAAPNRGPYDYNVYTNALPAGVASGHDPFAMPASFADTEVFQAAQLFAPAAMTGAG